MVEPVAQQPREQQATVAWAAPVEAADQVVSRPPVATAEPVAMARAAAMAVPVDRRELVVLTATAGTVETPVRADPVRRVVRPR